MTRTEESKETVADGEDEIEEQQTSRFAMKIEDTESDVPLIEEDESDQP